MKILSVSFPSNEEMEIEIDGESHTFGVLISRELLSMEEVDIAYYTQEHPLKSTIKIYVRTKPGYLSYDILEKAVNRLKEKLDEIEKKVRESLEK